MDNDKIDRLESKISALLQELGNETSDLTETEMVQSAINITLDAFDILSSRETET